MCHELRACAPWSGVLLGLGAETSLWSMSGDQAQTSPSRGFFLLHTLPKEAPKPSQDFHNIVMSCWHALCGCTPHTIDGRHLSPPAAKQRRAPRQATPRLMTIDETGLAGSQEVLTQQRLVRRFAMTHGMAVPYGMHRNGNSLHTTTAHQRATVASDVEGPHPVGCILAGQSWHVRAPHTKTNQGCGLRTAPSSAICRARQSQQGAGLRLTVPILQL